MGNKGLIVNGIHLLSLYQRDCLFKKECRLGFVTSKDARGHEHIRTQCTECGYQTGGPLPKSLLQPTDKVKHFNQRLYNAAYRRKLEEVYAMSGNSEEMNKRLWQMKKAVKQGRLFRTRRRPHRRTAKSDSLTASE